MPKFDRHQRIQNEQGLTLIEVLGAMAELSILVLSLVSLSQYTGQTVVKSDRESAALVIAQQKLSELRMNILENPTMPSTTSLASGFLDSPDPLFRVYFTTTPVGTTPVLPSEWDSSKIQSIQSMILLDDDGTTVSRALTVSVYWEGT